MDRKAEPREDLHFFDYWRVVSSRKELVIAMFLIVVTAGVLVTFLWMPKVYKASVKIQVKEETPDVEVLTREAYRCDPLFLRTQFEIIQSRPVIEEAIRRLELDDKLGRAYGYLAPLGKEKAFDQTVKIIARRMKVQQYRDTNLIEIESRIQELGGVPEEAPLLAARTADAIAEVYCARSARKSREVAMRAVEALGDALDKRRVEVTVAEKKVEDIRLKHKLDFIQRQSGTDWALSKQTLMELETRRILANKELIGKKSRYEELHKLSGRELLAAVMILVPNDRALTELVVARHRAEVQAASELNEKGAKHPDVVKLTCEIEKLNTVINDTVGGLMTGLKIECDAAEAECKGLNEELGRQKEAERKAEAGAYLEFEKASEELERARKMRDLLETRYEEEKIKLNIPKTNFDKIEPAKVPDQDDYDSPKPLLNILLSILAGLGTGIGLAFFFECLDASVKTIDDIERHMGVPVVGAIPQKVKPFPGDDAYGSHGEAYRVLRANIQFSKKFQGGKVIGVTSGSVGEGKSLTIFNLAYVYARLGDKVVVVDSDMHRPSQHRILKLSRDAGLANVLAGELELDQAVVPTEISNLHFLPSGRMSAGAHGLLDGARLGQLVKALKDRYGRVFFDGPPIIGVSDAAILVREMDGVLLVIQHRKYPLALVNRARCMIDNVGGNLIGVVLNNINILRDYSYCSHHAYSDAAKRKKRSSLESISQDAQT
ncbi:MAG: polysaccharide biosynthesis tyrosine autokinase [Verrucomicrobiota bacterium]|nr:polysaccharide biosynthesis tyrosine autokinase [Verrucomicrobiota bacterium]